MIGIAFDVVMAGIALAVAAFAFLYAAYCIVSLAVDWWQVRREPVFPNFNGYKTDLRLLKDWRSWDRDHPEWSEWVD